MGMNNEFNYRSRRSRPDSKLSLLEQRRRTRFIKGQFGLPESFGTNPFHVWYNVLAA
jgi:hypothetical protein